MHDTPERSRIDRSWRTKRPRITPPILLVVIAVVLLAVAVFLALTQPDTLASDDNTTTESSAAQQFPNVVDAVARQTDDGTWTFDVTISSPYDSPERYADAWRVLGPDGTEIGIRELTHDHANEQPFTRSLSGVVIPGDIREVTIEARDQLNGWGGTTKTVSLVG